MRQERPQIRLLVTDLDNTIWDWFRAWHKSFSAMLDKLVELSNVPESRLLAEIQVVHRARKTSEYSYLLNELPSLRDPENTLDPLSVYDEAVHVQNSERLRHTRLYPGVRDVFEQLTEYNVPVIAYSESVAYWTEWRIRKTGLDGLIKVLYTSPDHDLPDGVNVADLRTQPDFEYGLKWTDHRHVPTGTIKPNPLVLRKIISDFDIEPDQIVYVGDSLMKDVHMAQSVGVHDVLASYGIAQHEKGYDLLRQVSHWTDSEKEQERRLAWQPDTMPTYTLKRSYTELLKLFNFRSG
jgi:phosphoglycolate phosphatase